MRRAGFEFSVEEPDIDEMAVAGESAPDMVSRLADGKALAVVTRAGSHAVVVLAADTVVALGGEPLGKPEDADAAVEMLLRLSNTGHEAVTGYCLYGDGPRHLAAGVTSTTVRFKPIDRAAAREYVATGEPLYKAGAYAIQGLGRRFVAEISGSFTNVMGLPMEDITPLLEEHGIRKVASGK